MAYRNKTYVAFASEDIRSYWLMEAWRDNQHIDFNFHDAHDINTALDTSRPETIRRRLGERLSNTKQAVILLSRTTRPKAGRSSSFLYYEVEAIKRLGLPVVFSNLNGSRKIEKENIPQALMEYYSINVSFQPSIIKFALDEHVPAFQKNLSSLSPKSTPHFYKDHIYSGLGL